MELLVHIVNRIKINIVSDGTFWIDLIPDSPAANPSQFTVCNNILWFVGQTKSNGTELYYIHDSNEPVVCDIYSVGPH